MYIHLIQRQMFLLPEATGNVDNSRGSCIGAVFLVALHS